jgi:hypothetical protein
VFPFLLYLFTNIIIICYLQKHLLIYFGFHKSKFW